MANNDAELQDGCHVWLPFLKRFGEHARFLPRNHAPGLTVAPLLPGPRWD